ncbi:MAG: HNH endonuclease [Thiotrichales bacterium]
MAKVQGQQWNEREQLLALRLYMSLPFGQLHQHQPDVIKIANAIGRTPSAVAMKACNFASLDPALDRKGLGNVSKSDRQLWQAFMENSNKIAEVSESLFQQVIFQERREEWPDVGVPPEGNTETIQTVKVRRVQSFFRKSVLISYVHRCAVTGISDPKLLVASHIIPWKDNEKRRADPTNGIALNSLHDRLFDQGLMTIGDDFRVLLSTSVKQDLNMDSRYRCFLNIEGEKINLPERFRPDPEALDYHRENIFVG